MSQQHAAIKRRKAAKYDKRYRPTSEVTRTARAQRKDIQAAKAKRLGKTFGYHKK